MKSEYPDPLLAALETVGRLHHRSINRESAVAGLPLQDGWLTPQLFCRAAERCHMEANIVKCKLSEVHEASLPAVVLTEDGFAFIIVRKQGKQDVEVIFPETGSGSEIMSMSELDRFYSGFVILVKPAYEAEKRSNNAEKKIGKKNWFWNALWSYRSFYGRVAIATVFINFLALASSLFVMNVYDRVVPNQAKETLYVLAAGVLIAYIFEFLLKSLRTFFVDRAGKQIDSKLGALLFERVLGMKFSHRPASSGALASQARSYESLREFFTSATVATIVDLPFVFVFAGVVYMLGGIVAAPMIIGVVVALLIGLIAQIPMKKAVEQGYQASNQRHAIFVESVNSLETVKTCRAESVMQRRMEDSIEVSANSEQKSRWYSQQAVALVGFLQQLVNTSIIIFAFYQIMDEKMTMGAMIACVILSGRGLAPMIMLSSLLTRLQQSWRAYQGLDKLMKSPAEREAGDRRIELTGFESKVDFENVSFAYPGSPEGVSALGGIDLSIARGERVALIGRIGSGKSTLLRLAMGLYEPADGRVDVSGYDVRQLDPAELRGKIGFMGQESTLFYGKLRANLTMGEPWADDSKIWASLERAGLYEFVKSHPEGLDLMVHEGGTSLSGGQRQAICLARALLSEPDLLIFDEPTSAMDGLTEKGFVSRVDAYLQEQEGRTLIMATHKSSMLGLVDRVVVIDQGQVVNDGERDRIVATKSAEKEERTHLKPVAA